jgi:transposase
MYITSVPNRNSPPAILLRESFREDGKVKTRTIANLSHWQPERIEAMRRALRGEFDGITGDPERGAIFGVLFALKQLADQLGITQALGRSKLAHLALFLVLARIAHGGSRLSAVRWAQQHAVEDVLSVASFDEDDLYAALDWLAGQQEMIEKSLFHAHVERTGHTPVLMLYDVTSSYFEGECNELAAFGYNRDGKSGKQQIVVGLLTAADGEPLAVRVFEGNTADTSTVGEQIRLLKEQFGAEEVILVGDRGMIKAKGKKALANEGWRYITALTDAQVRTLLKRNILQPGLFDTDLTEVEYEDKRLILRRNESTRHREQLRRKDKLERLKENIDKRNAYVKEHPRAKGETGLKQLQQWVKHHKLSQFVTVSLEERMLSLTIDEQAMERNALLDGCYTLETDVSTKLMDTATVAARYLDLQQVERNFRTMKTGFLEVRPVFLRNAERTKAHVFVAMLALKITRAFESKLHQVFGTTDDDPKAITLADALLALSRITYNIHDCNGQTKSCLPRLDAQQSSILSALGLSFPKANTSRV